MLRAFFAHLARRWYVYLLLAGALFYTYDRPASKKFVQGIVAGAVDFYHDLIPATEAAVDLSKKVGDAKKNMGPSLESKAKTAAQPARKDSQ